MTATIINKELEILLLERVREQGDPLVGALLTEVAREADVDIEIVASTMWDLVESNALAYGADAHVRIPPGS